MSLPISSRTRGAKGTPFALMRVEFSIPNASPVNGEHGRSWQGAGFGGGYSQPQAQATCPVKPGAPSRSDVPARGLATVPAANVLRQGRAGCGRPSSPHAVLSRGLNLLREKRMTNLDRRRVLFGAVAASGVPSPPRSRPHPPVLACPRRAPRMWGGIVTQVGSHEIHRGHRWRQPLQVSPTVSWPTRRARRCERRPGLALPAAGPRHGCGSHIRPSSSTRGANSW
jgi:hypothetical protein